VSKTEFPLGVELPLRGGGVAVLYEFFEGKWYGRSRGEFCSMPGAWEAQRWLANGEALHGAGATFDILPPKRKAWVVWYPDDDDRHSFRKPAEIVTSEPYAALRATELGGTYQQITEP